MHCHRPQVVTKGNSTKFVPGTGPPVGQDCTYCGFRHQMGGPIWSEPMQDNTFVDAVLGQLKDNAADFASQKRLIGLVTSLREELQDQVRLASGDVEGEPSFLGKEVRG